MKDLVRATFPPYHSAIVDGSHDTFAQAIYLAEVSSYHNGRMCLMGDAGTVAQPFTAGGVFKGMNNALDLAAALAEQDDVDQAGDCLVQTGTRHAWRNKGSVPYVKAAIMVGAVRQQ